MTLVSKSVLDLAPRRRTGERLLGRLRSVPALAVTVLALLAAAGVGTAAAFSPVLVLGAIVGAAVVVLVWRRPEFAAYLLIGATPLIVGIDRDRIFPLLRPNEALLGLLIAVLVTRAALRLRVDTRPRISMGRVATGLTAMAVASSVLPLIWMVLRGRQVQGDDLTYALVMWKTLAVYALVRYCVRTQAQVRVCIWVSIAVATVVGLIQIAQSLGLFGVRELLIPWYSSFGYTAGTASARAGSTVGLPAATADLMVLNLVLAIGLWWKDRRFAVLLVPAGLVFMMATFAAAEFSSALGLVIGLVTVAALLGRLDLLKYGLVGLPVAVAALWPTVQQRIVEFQSMHGVPQSWLVRWYNLKTYFWPELFSGSNPFVGVRPSARVPVNGAYGYVWIESGYTWLLWGGGVFLLGAFAYFAWASLTSMRSINRVLSSYSAVAALAAYAGVVVVVVLMVFDPHITYRGFADALYAVLALAQVQRIHLASRSVTAEFEQEVRP